MKHFRVKFYQHTKTKHGVDEKYLGYVVVNNHKMSDDCSYLAKAFRNANALQKTATGVVVEEV